MRAWRKRVARFCQRRERRTCHSPMRIISSLEQHFIDLFLAAHHSIFRLLSSQSNATHFSDQLVGSEKTDLSLFNSLQTHCYTH